MSNRTLMALVAALLALGSALAQPAAPMGHSHNTLASGAAFAPDGTLWITGLNATGQLFVQHTTDSALQQWTPPQVLAADADISADGENHPKLAFGPKGTVVLSYTQPHPKPYTGFIRMLRSTDAGQSFGPPVTVHHDRQEITHRFESIAFDAQGDLHTLWIDKRDLAAKGKGYVGAAIYTNVSHDAGASFGPDTKLADHSCECCRIALATGPDGQLRALWRHVFGEQTRDHAFASLAPGAPAAVRASYDDWQINACPHHGPGLARADVPGPAGYHAIWFGIRQVQGAAQAAVRYGRLDALGQPVPDTVRALPDARAEHADVAASGPKVAVVWRSTQGHTSRLVAWLSTDGGQNFERRELAQTEELNDHPRLVQSGTRMVVVWRLAQGVQVHELTF